MGKGQIYYFTNGLMDMKVLIINDSIIINDLMGN